ncbi:MAG TPA: hypothetical protein VJ997_12705 [Longimicrobiales bacterium]|nr:hypothetical protein [Longimicrobiales bacterium]
MILLITVRLVGSRRLQGGSYALLVLCVLGPVCYGAMLANPPGTFPSGLYQRLFIGCTWLWLVGACGGLISGSWVGTPGAEERESSGPG